MVTYLRFSEETVDELISGGYRSLCFTYFLSDINRRGGISQCHELSVGCSWQCLLSISILQVIRVLSGSVAAVYSGSSFRFFGDSSECLLV